MITCTHAYSYHYKKGETCVNCGYKKKPTIQPTIEFKPGLYKHYRGGLYTAICLVTHHETRQPMVLYVSHTYGGLNVRPLDGWPSDTDGWIGTLPDGTPRFKFIGDLPCDTNIEDRCE